MSMTSPVAVLVDHAQVRLDPAQDRCTCFVQGTNPRKGDKGPIVGWDVSGATGPAYYQSGGCFIEPITYSARISPNVLHFNWYTNNTGIYYKYQVADFTFSEAKWVDFDSGAGFKDFIQNNDAIVANSQGYISVANTNTGVSYSYFKYNKGDEDFVEIEFGYCATVGDIGLTKGLAFRKTSKGAVICYKDGVIVGGGKISGNKTENQKTRQLEQIIVMPYRASELVVFSPSSGDGFNVAFPAGTVVAPSGIFWFRFPTAGQSVQFQFAPLIYPDKATLVSTITSFPRICQSPPTVLRSFEYVPAGVPATAPYVAHWSVWQEAWNYINPTYPILDKRCRIVYSLYSGNNNRHSPDIYGAVGGLVGIAGETDGSTEVDLMQILESDGCLPARTEALSLQVGEGAKGTKAEIAVRNPDAYNIPSFRKQSNRPILIAMNNETGEADALLNGVLKNIHVDHGLTPADDLLHGDIEDKYDLLYQYRYSDPCPLDGEYFGNTIEGLLGLGGIFAYDIDPVAYSYQIPFPLGGRVGDWGQLIKVGDTPGEWIDRLYSTYAGDWFYGMVPRAGRTRIFKSYGPTTASTTPEVILTEDTDEAIASLVAEGFSNEDARQYVGCRVIGKSSIVEVPPVANDIWIIGWDPIKQIPIVSHRQDTEAVAIGTPPALRPENWAGALWKYGLFDPAINTQALCDAVCNIEYKRLTPLRRLLTLDMRMMVFKNSNTVPLWRGDVIQLNDKLYRVKTLRTNFALDPDPWTVSPRSTRISRPTSYVVEQIPETPENDHTLIARTVLTTAREIQQHGKQLGYDKVLVRNGGDFLLQFSREYISDLTS